MKKRILFSLAALMLAFSSPVVHADDLDPNFLLLPAYDWTGPQRDKFLVGDEAELVVSGVALPDGVDAKTVTVKNPPGAVDLHQQGWDVLKSESQPSAADPKKVDVHIFVVPMKGGADFPSMAIVDNAGKPFARANPWHAQATSAIGKDDPKPQEPSAAKPPVSLTLPILVPIIGSILFLSLLTFAIYYLIRWMRARAARRPAVPAGPPPTEDEVALSALTELEREGLLKKKAYKKHYFRVSEILKAYVGSRYEFDALDRTTREMLKALSEGKWLDATQTQDLESLFEHLDLIKFTDTVPGDGDAETVLPRARKFVLSTRKRTAPSILATSATPGEGPSAVL